MSTPNPKAAAGTAQPTAKTETSDGPLIPGRADILKSFADLAESGSRALSEKKPEEKVAPAAAGGEKPKVLSQVEATEAIADPKAEATQETEAEKQARETTEAAELAERAKATGLTPVEQKTAEDLALKELTERATKAGKTVEEQFALEEAEEAKAAGGGEEDHLAEDAELKTALTPETQEKINKRIGKEVAKTKAAVEAKAALETKLAEAERKLTEAPRAVTATATGPLANVTTVEGLRAEEAKANEAINQAEDLLLALEDSPEEVEATLKTAKVALDEYTPAAMRRYLANLKANATKFVRTQIPARATWLQKADVAAAQALKLMPELADKNSPRAKKFWEITNAMPSIKNEAGWTKMVAVQVLGLERLGELETAAAKPAPVKVKPRVKPVVIPSPKGTPAGGAPRRANKNEVDAETASAALNGDKNAKWKILEGLF
jgi:hypothetical protein